MCLKVLCAIKCLTNHMELKDPFKFINPHTNLYFLNLFRLVNKSNEIKVLDGIFLVYLSTLLFNPIYDWGK